MPARATTAILISALCACGGSRKPTPAPAPQPAVEPAQPAVEARCDPGPDAPSHGGTLAWYHDDYAAALACARIRGVPLVIDLWAPWCHTCLSMKQTVLVDPALAPLADRFVWLALDTDREVNAAAVGKFPPAAWPTFYVVSPADESIQSRFVGAASVRQFRELLVEGERAFLDDRAGSLAADSPLRLLRDAHRASAAGDHRAAAELYGKALAAAPADWPRRPDVLVSRISALYRAGDHQGCVALAAAKAEQTGRAASAADFTYYAMTCAARLGDDQTTEPVLEHLYERTRAVVNDESAPLSIDDRSDALRILRELKEMVGDQKTAKQLAERQKKLLDEAIAGAPNAFAAMTYNWPAAEVYVYLDRAGELVPVLEKSVAALPDQYDPPYRLGWVLLQLERYDEALAAANKALGLAYGPRKTRVQALVADIYRARGDRAAELAARKEVVKIWEGLPADQQNAAALQQAREEVGRLEAR